MLLVWLALGMGCTSESEDGSSAAAASGTDGSGAASTSTTGGATGSGGAAGGGGSGAEGGAIGSGGAGDCDALGVCGDGDSGCIDCSRTGACAEEHHACESDPDCAAFDACNTGCAGNRACEDACFDQHQGGASLWIDFFVCAICTACPMSCDDPACP